MTTAVVDRYSLGLDEMEKRGNKRMKRFSFTLVCRHCHSVLVSYNSESEGIHQNGFSFTEGGIGFQMETTCGNCYKKGKGIG